MDYNESFIANVQIAILLIRWYAVGDPDLQIKGLGGGHPDPEIRSGQSPKKFFSALLASVWSKNKGTAPLGPFPGSASGMFCSMTTKFALM